MNYINKKAKKVMDKLTDGVTPDNAHKKINNAGSGIMPVDVEYLYDLHLWGGDFPVYSVTHYYEQNGDMMRDPDMEFFRDGQGNYYPIYFRQDNLGLVQEVLIFDEEGNVKQFRPKLMRDLASFAGTWMENIRQQQGI
jgi:hypothetical protein